MQGLMLKVVIDTCILKLASFPADDNPAALIVQMGVEGLFEWWVSPAILDEYTDVMCGDQELLAEIVQCVDCCYPLTELAVIAHEPDNRFVECAFSVAADYLVTVNCARGHFDRLVYGETRVMTPGRFVSLPEIIALQKRLS